MLVAAMVAVLVVVEIVVVVVVIAVAVAAVVVAVLACLRRRRPHQQKTPPAPLVPLPWPPLAATDSYTYSGRILINRLIYAYYTINILL